MSYQVTARKWRPQKFSDMVGQEHIARTLRNAIASERIAHAYLFVGPRGIGKTTSARIFAKALNCKHPVDGEPCCECSSCKAIADESSVDVIEIDAATHTQVEKARDICEDVLHLPISSKYKIYIIDEVHMLSKSAWNALLKTIEEPPAHAKFIFATTEVNKVLPTVISRCQRFDLSRIPADLITKRLAYIAEQEQIRISPQALHVIARAADGGMRDAQSLLDQLVSFFGTEDGSTEISESQALSLFGLTAPGEMEALVGNILSNDKANAIVSIHQFAHQGKNLETLFDEILSWLRGILMTRILPDPNPVLDETPEKLASYRNLANAASPETIQILMEQMAASSYMLHEAVNKQVFMETILLKSMRAAHAVRVEDLLARLNQIRKNGELDGIEKIPSTQFCPIRETPSSNGTLTQNRQAAEPLPVTTAVPPSAAPRQETASEPLPTPPPAAERISPDQQAAAAVPVPSVPSAPSAVSGNLTESTSIREDSTPAGQAVREMTDEPVTLKEEKALSEKVIADEAVAKENILTVSSVTSPSDSASPILAEGSGLLENPEGAAEEEGEENGTEGVDAAEESAAESIVETASAVRENSMSLQERFSAENLWERLTERVSELQYSLGGLMQSGFPERIENQVLHVLFDERTGRTNLEILAKAKITLTKELRNLTMDSEAELSFVLRKGLLAEEKPVKRLEELKKEAAENPMVRETQDLFSGMIVDVFA